MKKNLMVSFIMLTVFSLSCHATEIVYWSVWNEPEIQAQVLKKIFRQFEKKNPGIRIKSVWNGRQSLVKLRSYLAAGKTVDVFDGDSHTFLGLVLKEDLAYDLKNLSMRLKEKLLPNATELFFANGKQYGLPYIHNSIMFFYSQKAFEKAKIQKVPETWQDFLSTCHALKKAGFRPLAVEGDVMAYQYYYAGYFLDRLAGKDFIIKAATDKSGEMWRRPLVRQLLEFERDLWNKGYIPEASKGYQWPAGQNDIAMEKTAMTLVGSWLPTELQKSVGPEFKWGAFAFPKVPGGTNEMNLMVATMSMGVYSKSKNRGTAQSLLEFILEFENQKLMADMAMVGVMRKEVLWDKCLKSVANVVKNSTDAFITDGISTLHPEYASTILKPMHSKVFMGEISHDEFITSMVEKTKAYWAKR